MRIKEGAAMTVSSRVFHSGHVLRPCSQSLAVMFPEQKWDQCTGSRLSKEEGGGDKVRVSVAWDYIDSTAHVKDFWFDFKLRWEVTREVDERS